MTHRIGVHVGPRGSLARRLAQILVQASKDAGEIKLSASADGLTTATATVKTVAGPARPSVP